MFFIAGGRAAVVDVESASSPEHAGVGVQGIVIVWRPRPPAGKAKGERGDVQTKHVIIKQNYRMH